MGAKMRKKRAPSTYDVCARVGCGHFLADHGPRGGSCRRHADGCACSRFSETASGYSREVRD